MGVSGCQGAFDLPLPGGAANRGDIFRVTAEFADVLDLVPQSSVKVDQVTVGSVEKIELNGWTARVTLRLPKNVKLPDNAVAELKQTSLLGEKYVAARRPDWRAPPRAGSATATTSPSPAPAATPRSRRCSARCRCCSTVAGSPSSRSSRPSSTTRVGGNEAQIKDLIKQLDTFIGGLDDQKSEIVRAIDNIDKLAGKLAAQKDDIAKALEALPGGLKVLADQRQQLVQMLQALSRLGAVGTQVIQQSKADTAANLKALAPILAPADQGRRRPAEVVAAAAHLPLLGRHDRRHEGRLHQHVRRPGPQPRAPRRQPRRSRPRLPGGGLPAALPTGLPTLAPLPTALGQHPGRCRSRPAAPSTQPCSAGVGLPSARPRQQSGSSSSDSSWRSLYGGAA